MSVIVKSTEMNYKDPNSGDYVGINVLAEKKTSDLLNEIEAKGQTVISDIPASYDDLNNIVADSYDSTKTYSVGDYVRYYNGTHDKLYRCVKDISTAEVWTSGHWAEVVMADEISDLKEVSNQLTGFENIPIIDRGYINCNTNPISLTPITPSASSTVGYNIVPCQEGDVFYISTRGGEDARGWAFVQSDGTRIQFASAYISISNTKFIAPAGSAYLIINNYDRTKSYKVLQSNPPLQQEYSQVAQDLNHELTELKQLNVYDLLRDYVNYTGNSVIQYDEFTQSWRVHGSIGSDSNYNLFISTSSFPAGMVPGGTYTLHVESDDPSKLFSKVWYRKNNEWTQLTTLRVTNSFTIPEDAVGLIIRIDALAGTYNNCHILVRYYSEERDSYEVNLQIDNTQYLVDKLDDAVFYTRTLESISGVTTTGSYYNLNMLSTNQYMKYTSFDISGYTDSEGFCISRMVWLNSSAYFPGIIYQDASNNYLGYALYNRGPVDIRNYFLDRRYIPQNTKYIILNNSTSYSDPTIKTAEREVKLQNSQRSCMYSFEASSNIFHIYVPSPYSDKYTEYTFQHLTNSSTNYDSWRIYHIYVCDSSFNRLWYLMATSQAGVECEGAIMEKGKSDFIGGFHGDEAVIEAMFFADGQILSTSSDISLTEFNKFEARIKSQLYHCGTNTQVLLRKRSDVWSSEGVVIFNHFDVTDDAIFTVSHTAMLGVAKFNDSQTDIIDLVTGNHSPYPISMTSSQSGITYLGGKNLNDVSYFGKIYVNLKLSDCLINNEYVESTTGQVITQPDNKTIKIYLMPFNSNEGISFTSGNSWQSKATQQIYPV